jgi:imidazolonepropionase-like amidohydrolase
VDADASKSRRRWLARSGRLGAAVAQRAQSGLASARSRRADTGGAPTRGVAFAGTVWTGGDATPTAGIVIVSAGGEISEIALGPRPTLPHELLVLGGDSHWVVPGIVDAHVHLGFDPAAGDDRLDRAGVSGLNTGLVGVRDLGAPLRRASRWQTGHRTPVIGSPFVAVSGPILTAVGGYPSRSWGAGGFAEFVNSPVHARSLVQQLASQGVDLIKIALERGGQGWPVLEPDTVLSIVDAAHALGLPVVAHALTVDMVVRALDAGVDELTHTPTELLGEELVGRIADSAMSVTSTLQTFFSGGAGRIAAQNAADLIAAGVRLRYGTDLGNSGTRTGVDPRELDRLADTGLGRLGALRAATQWAAEAPGMRLRTGMLQVGQPAAMVLLPFSPVAEPGVWRTPAAVYADGRLTVSPARSTRRAAGDPSNR